jgi:hypothetical protein
VLPALIGGMGVSFGVLFAALKDGKDVLERGEQPGS